MTLDGYAVQIFPDVLTDGSPCYVATIPDLPGCASWSETPDEAAAHLASAQRAWMASVKRHGLPVPPPGDVPAVTWTWAVSA